jgi:hypothetical protein
MKIYSFQNKHKNNAHSVIQNSIAVLKALHHGETGCRKSAGTLFFCLRATGETKNTPWRDANPRSSVPLAEMMTTTPPRQEVEKRLQNDSGISSSHLLQQLGAVLADKGLLVVAGDVVPDDPIAVEVVEHAQAGLVIFSLGQIL